MAIEEESPANVPIWMLTFGDMMALMLTFFVMLVSMSEMKSPEKFQAVAASMRSQFGGEVPATGLGSSWAKPRSTKISTLTAAGRTRKIDLMYVSQDSRSRADFESLTHAGTQSAIRASLDFMAGSAELSELQRQELQKFALQLSGTTHKIDIRGHAALQPVVANSGSVDQWQVSYDRCRKTMQYLVNDLQLDSHRVRLSVAGSSESQQLGSDASERQANDRVEIYLQDDVGGDLAGAPAVQAQ